MNWMVRRTGEGRSVVSSLAGRLGDHELSLVKVGFCLDQCHCPQLLGGCLGKDTCEMGGWVSEREEGVGGWFLLGNQEMGLPVFHCDVDLQTQVSEWLIMDESEALGKGQGLTEMGWILKPED